MGGYLYFFGGFPVQSAILDNEMAVDSNKPRQLLGSD